MPDGNVLRMSSRSRRPADVRRQRSLSANHGKAQLATSCPAASAMTWLLADEPRLLKPSRYCWCQRICCTARPSSSNSPATPGQLSSRRRIQARLISRVPTSIPLVQCTPDRKGFSRYQDRSWPADPARVRLIASEKPGRGQQREVLQA